MLLPNATYLLEDAGSYESTTGVEGSSPAHVQVSLIKRLQNSQEVSTLQLDGDRHREREEPQCETATHTTVLVHCELFTVFCV